jgi:poly(A) polymerase
MRRQAGSASGRASLDAGGLPRFEWEVLAETSRFLRSKRARGYLVGGLLRDYLVGRRTDDIDIVVLGVEPERVARHLTTTLGLSRPVAFPRFRTVLVAGRGVKVEICELDEDPGTDALRRDFTVNCLYADLRLFTPRKRRIPILDPTGRAKLDLEARLLVTPVDPLVTFGLDPLRIMRAVRFGAAGFRIAPAVIRAMGAMAYLLTRIAPERLRMELEKILVSLKVGGALELMYSAGITESVMPELARAHGFAQRTPYHSYDLFTHLAKTTRYAPPELPLRLAALFHDLGKLTTQLAKPDRMVYYGHEKVSAATAETIMRRLKFSNRMVDLTSFLVAHHMVNYSSSWSDKAVRRFVRKMGKNLEDVLILAQADRKAQRPVARGQLGVDELRARIESLEACPGSTSPLPVDGRDIMEILRIGPGPLVGQAKEFLTERAMAWPRMTRDQATEILRAWAAAHVGPSGSGGGRPGAQHMY